MFAAILDKLFGKPKSRPTELRLRFRPGMEILEDRTVPTSLTTGSPYALEMIQGPGAQVYAGQTFNPPIQIDITDAAGNLVTNATDEIELAEQGDSQPLGGAYLVTAVGGIATFNDVWFTYAGSDRAHAIDVTEGGVFGAYSPTITVLPIPTALSVSAKPSPSPAGQPVTLTAVVTTAPPAGGSYNFNAALGLVQFFSGSTLLANAPLDGIAGNDQATSTIYTLPVGSDPIEASYLGNSEDTFASHNFLGSSATTTTVVTAVNTPPTLSNPGNQTNQEGTTVSLQLQGSDTDGDTLSYSIVGILPGLGFSSTTGLISGTLTAAPGQYTVTATVTDSYGYSASQTFTWTVTIPNTPPTLVNPGDQTSNEGDAVSLQLQGTDPNGAALSYSLTGLPDGLAFDPNIGLISGTISSAAPQIDGGQYTVTATVTDSYGLSASQTFSWTITDIETPPVFQPVAPQIVNENAPLTLPVTAVNVEAPDEPLSYALVNPPAGASIDPNTAQFTWVPGCPQVGTYIITVTATDGDGATASESFQVTVADVSGQHELAGTIAQVQGFVSSGQLTAGQVQPLLANLTAAQQALAVDDAPAAVQQITAFQNGVASLVQAGDLSAAAAQSLEVPSIVYWTGAGDGFSWNDTANWNDNALPTPCDDVYIRTTPGLVIEHPTGDVWVHSLHSYNPINFTGTLKLTTDSEVHEAFNFNGTLEQLNGTLELDGGGNLAGTLDGGAGTQIVLSGGHFTLADGAHFTGDGLLVFAPIGIPVPNVLVDVAAGATATDDKTTEMRPGAVIQGAGDFVIGKTFSWTGGEMKGSGETVVLPNGTLKIEGDAGKRLEQRKLFNGGTITWTGGKIEMANGAQIENDFLAKGFDVAGDLTMEDADPKNASQFKNDGDFEKSAGAGTANIGVAFTNLGTVKVAQGTADFSKGFTQPAKDPALSPAVMNLAAGTTLSTPLLRLGGGKIDGTGTLKLTGTSTNPGQGRWEGGTLTGMGAKFVITTDATLSLFGPITIAQGLTVENHGTIGWVSGELTLGNALGAGSPVEIINESGGVFIAQAGSAMSGFRNTTFNNKGKFLALATMNGQKTVIRVNFNSSGEVDVGAGDLVFTGVDNFSGPCLVQGGATLIFQRGPHTFTGADTIAGQGTVEVQSGSVISKGLLTINTDHFILSGGSLDGPGFFEVHKDFKWTGGDVGAFGTVHAKGTTEISGAGDKTITNGGFVNYGKVTWTDTGRIVLEESAAVINTGTFDVKNDAKIFDGQGVQGTVRQFINEANATFMKSGGAKVTDIQVYFLNEGSVELQGREVDFDNGYRQDKGSTVLAGGTLGGKSTEFILYGALSGPGTLEAQEVRFYGKVDFGNAIGELKVDGDLWVSSESVIKLTIAGAKPGTGYDFISVTGNAELTTDQGAKGVLVVNVDKAAIKLKATDEFGILQVNGVTRGVFQAEKLQVPGVGLTWNKLEYFRNGGGGVLLTLKKK